MDRKKHMEGTGDAHDRYEGELPEAGDRESPSEADEQLRPEDYEPRSDDTVPDGPIHGWSQNASHVRSEAPVPPLDAARPRRATLRISNGAPRSIPAAQPGLLSGWAERSIQRPEEDDYDAELAGHGESAGEGNALDSNQLDEWADSQGDTLLTKMDMDWDEEEALTTLREGTTILPPPQDEAPPSEDDEVHGAGVQNIVPFRAPGGLNAPIFSVGVPSPASSEMFSSFDRKQSSKGRWLWYAVAAAVGVMLAFVAIAVFGPAAPPTVMFVTKPVDATVLVDGRILTGATSPFTVQGLAPDVDHSIEVRKDGFLARTQPLRLTAGEVKTLPDIELAPVPPHAGFALASVPPGANVLVDGRKLDRVTPLRVEDLGVGSHTLQVTLEGYQPWQTVFFAVSAQVIELPPAELVRSSPHRMTWSERVEARKAAAAAARAERAEAAASRASAARSVRLGAAADDEPAPEASRGRVHKRVSRGDAVATPSEQGEVHKRFSTGDVGAAEVEQSKAHGRLSAGDEATTSDSEQGTVHKRVSAGDSAAPDAAEQGQVHKRFWSGEQAQQRANARTAPDDSTPDDKPAPSHSREPVPAAANATGTGGEKGAFSINSRPWSQVTIDGKLVGNTPQLAIPLVAGRHKVKLANPELGIVRGFAVDIAAGETTTKTIEFGE